MSLVARMNKSDHTYEWMLSHTWMSHVTHMTESCHTQEWVVSHTWISHVTHMNESCHTHEWVMTHTWMSRVTHMHDLHDNTCQHDWSVPLFLACTHLTLHMPHVVPMCVWESERERERESLSVCVCVLVCVWKSSACLHIRKCATSICLA